MMQRNELLFHTLREIIWWILTGMIAFAVVYPITLKIDYLYLWVSYAFVFTTVLYFRYTLSLSSLPFMRPPWVRFLLFTLNIVLFFFFLEREQKLIGLLDNFYTEDFGFPVQGVIMYDHIKEKLFEYLRFVIQFFGTGSLIMIVIFNVRLLVSWWQFYKYKSSRLMED